MERKIKDILGRMETQMGKNHKLSEKEHDGLR